MGAKISPLLLIDSGLNDVAYGCRQVCFLYVKFQTIGSSGQRQVPSATWDRASSSESNHTPLMQVIPKREEGKC